MTYQEAFQRFGLPASLSDRKEICCLLTLEIELGRRGSDREEMLRCLSVLLFSLGAVEDSLLIWAAKRSNFDANCGLDVQLLCGAGLSATKAFLEDVDDPDAPAALQSIVRCESGGEFDGFSPATWISQYHHYYGLEADNLSK